MAKQCPAMLAAMALAPLLNALVLAALAFVPSVTATLPGLEENDQQALPMTDFDGPDPLNHRCYYGPGGYYGYCVDHDSVEICVIEPTDTYPCASVQDIPLVDDNWAADFIWCVATEALGLTCIDIPIES